ncbi:MAG TPA: hypothetical protein ENI23_05915 [bacterium]|nr:hypothetical protein [bacterium]
MKVFLREIGDQTDTSLYRFGPKDPDDFVLGKDDEAFVKAMDNIKDGESITIIHKDNPDNFLSFDLDEGYMSVNDMSNSNDFFYEPGERLGKEALEYAYNNMGDSEVDKFIDDWDEE